MTTFSQFHTKGNPPILHILRLAPCPRTMITPNPQSVTAMQLSRKPLPSASPTIFLPKNKKTSIISIPHLPLCVANNQPIAVPPIQFPPPLPHTIPFLPIPPPPHPHHPLYSIRKPKNNAWLNKMAFSSPFLPHSQKGGIKESMEVKKEGKVPRERRSDTQQLTTPRKSENVPSGRAQCLFRTRPCCRTFRWLVGCFGWILLRPRSLE
jgi:hypothetical protein